MAKFAHLVVDTSAFIKNVQLQDFAECCYTVQGVVDEIKNDRQLKRLVVLPYSLIVKEPDADVLTKIVAVAKKTGDFASLSLVDLKVMALTYQLEKQHVGTEHLIDEPKIARTICSSGKPQELVGSTLIAGFYNGKQATVKKQLESEPCSGQQKELEDEVPDVDTAVNDNELEQNFAELSTVEVERFEALLQQNLEANKEESSEVENGREQQNLETDFEKPYEVEIHEEEYSENEDNQEDDSNDEDSNDDEGWITPSNIKEVKRDFGLNLLEDNPSPVACMTTDFAMQNVLKQIGLNIAALDGRVIKHARTYILRCYACFKTTPDSTKVFCPKCGNKTLKKVAVSLDENGQQMIHINSRRPLTARHKNRPVSKFDGGKHSTNPILFEDQPLPMQRISAKAKAKTNALGDDYTAGYSPFVMRDVDSRSAVLRGNSNLKQWMKNYDYDNYRRGYKK
ncbi:RNA-binding protein NOB1 [Toxorhynchites rutilus septentrionalis]|uniref:RNA-binding protein NOB1 n=1 Tax=Toxorhynchites rutilus septentrionalis TaxID=329112 RepID=UPI0024785FBA|nr:RNA-binding protein NOB1 [Toxorhynchites rutilus septentrionalis]